MAISIGLLALLYAAYAAVVFVNQRRLIYYPTHGEPGTALEPWAEGGRIIGYCRPAGHPRAVWLMAHGNGGQASQRGYVLAHMAPDEALYVLEYPGYGLRGGTPSMASMNRAAAEAYQALRREHPGTPVCVLGESIGSGPASFLCTLAPPPDKLVLVVPFDVFASVASEHMPLLPVRLLLRDAWDNVEALRGYRGPVAIYGARDDRIIPPRHARRLAARLPGAAYIEIEGGHNDWPDSGRVRIER